MTQDKTLDPDDEDIPLTLESVKAMHEKILTISLKADDIKDLLSALDCYEGRPELMYMAGYQSYLSEAATEAGATLIALERELTERGLEQLREQQEHQS